jgi:hypothetical protein
VITIEAQVVRRTTFVVSREAPPGGVIIDRRVQHSEEPAWESSVWQVDTISSHVDQAMRIPAGRASDLRPGIVVHLANRREYEILGLAYCIDCPPRVNDQRVLVYYKALKRPVNCHGMSWVRPLLGQGGWLLPKDNMPRFSRAEVLAT